MTYRIKDWDDNFENNRTRDLKEMHWVPFKNNHDGYGYCELLDHEDGPAHFGAWVAIVQVASRCGVRGTLLRDGVFDLDPKAISRMVRMPETLIKNAIERLLKIGWIEEIQSEKPIPHEGAGLPQEGAPKSQEGDYGKKGKKEGNGREGNGPPASPKPPDQPEPEINPLFLEAANHLKRRVLETKQKIIKESHLKAWADTVRLMVDRDKRKLEDIHTLIDECHNMPPSSSGFTWRDNILSMDTLREKWNEGRISIGMTKNQKGAGNGTGFRNSEGFARPDLREKYKSLS